MKFEFYNSIFRLVISNLTGYDTFHLVPKGTKRSAGISPALDSLKQRVLDYLLREQSKRKVKPINWSIAWQIHPGSGLPHLDILLVFQKNVRVLLTSFDYLIKDLNLQQLPKSDSFTPGHVWITAYSPTKLNKAILQYGFKQDPSVITNLTLQKQQQLIQLNLLKTDPYLYLQQQMLKDPLHFNLQQYVRLHNLDPYISSWSSIKTKLKDMQVAAANLKLKQKQGFKYINRALIEANLNSDQLNLYDSWSGYQTIVDYLNQIVIDGTKRPFKSKHLLIVGPAGIGKTSLISEPNNKAGRTPMEQLVSTYHMGMRHWFPKYQDGVYKLILWNQMKLTSYSYDFLLKFLEGSPVDLPYHGGATKKADNQLIYMTSNLPLQRHIQLKFWNHQDRESARQNLSKRIEQIKVPPGYNLFLLQKLLT